MPAKMLKFEDWSVEDNLCFDTSFVLKLFGRLSPTKETANFDYEKNISNKCKAFAKKLRDNKVFVFVSDFVIDECLFNLLKWKFMEEAAIQFSDHKKWEDVYKKNPAIMQKYNNVVDEYFNFVKDNGIGIINYDPLSKENGIKKYLSSTVRNLIKQYDMLPRDLFIIQLAIANDVTNFVSCDRDWSRFSDITVFSPF